MATTISRVLCTAAACWLCVTPLYAQGPFASGVGGKADPQPPSLQARSAAVPPAAQPPQDIRNERLQGLTKAELQVLEPYLQAGPIALAEFTDDKEATPAINVAAIVHAPPASVAALIQKPEAFPRYMRTLDEVTVVQRRGNALVYDWRWRLSLLTLRGRNVMTVFPPPPDRLDAGYRITIDNLSGDLGTGRVAIRILPRSDRGSNLVISMRVDLRNANYVTRQIAKAARSVNRTANMSLACAMLLSLRHEAERLAGVAVPQRAPGALRKPSLDAQAVLPLLTRGDLVLLDMSGDRLDQVAVFGLILQERSLVREVMLDADSFGAALVPGSTAKVIARQGTTTTFDWDVNLPLVGVSGRMRMRDANPIVTVDAIEGALQGGRWNFETSQLTENATLLASWAKFDVRSSNWFVRRLTDVEPYLGHGMSAAGEVMLVRAVRSQTGKRAAQRAAASGVATATP